MRLLTAIIILHFISCNRLEKNQLPFWKTQKTSFKYQNIREFVSDSTLRADLKTFKKSNHHLFGKISSEPVYLYSWQDRDSSKNEFTIVKDDGELGLKIFYFILDKEGSLISSTQIAGKGSEGGYWFETRSKFIGKDTILNIGAITQWYDFEKQQKLEKTKGDSTFSYLVIDRNGKVKETLFKQVKYLHLENNNPITRTTKGDKQ